MPTPSPTADTKAYLCATFVVILCTTMPTNRHSSATNDLTTNATQSTLPVRCFILTEGAWRFGIPTHTHAPIVHPAPVHNQAASVEQDSGE